MAQLTATIKLWDQLVGAVAWSEEGQFALFEYDGKFLKGVCDIAPLMMPLGSGRKIYSFREQTANNETFKGLPGLLADMLPDKYGNALINAWLATQGRPTSSLTPIETLCFIGKRGMGALEIEPSLREENKRTTRVYVDELVGVANKILDSREHFQTQLSKDEEAALTDILKIGTSAGGARAKAVIAFNEKTNEVRSGQVKAPAGFGYWVLKFDGVHDTQFGASTGYGKVEMAYHLMAVQAGIEMTECRLFEEHGRSHFMTKRFDRGDDGSKIHMQSLCAMRHFDFNLVGYYAYEQVFETMRMLGLPYPEAEQMFIRMVFNVLARNCDDHTKNFAFLMDQAGNWRLSPAFDICHAYRPGSHWVSAQSLTVNGKREGITDADFEAVAQRMNIKKAKHLILQVKEIVLNWEHFAEEVEVESPLRDAIRQTLRV